jgi:hypothetical protein
VKAFAYAANKMVNSQPDIMCQGAPYTSHASDALETIDEK